jgi:choline kinase
VKAIILAAGVGRRLGDEAQPPKALLRFAGKSLLQRHVEILRRCGVSDIAVVVGHQAETIRAELERLDGGGLTAIDNRQYRSGSVVSLWSAREVLSQGEEVLLMDADVLYDHRLMARLLGSEAANCLLVDRDIEPGEEPVKLCVKDGRIVDFHKLPRSAYDWHGESVGFFRLAPEAALALAERAGAYVADGRAGLEYEEPLRDLMLDAGASHFGFEEVTGLPWTEIDFPEDVRRAREVVLPQLVA